MSHISHVLAIGTAVPSHRVSAAEAHDLLRRFWPRLERLHVDDAAVGTRYACEPLENLLAPGGLTQSSRAYRHHALALARSAADRALAASKVAPNEIDMIVTVSCTGYMVPSLDVHLIQELGLRPDVIRIPITELGCSGGAAAIALAHRHIGGSPAHRVLVVAVEVPSLTFQPADASLDNLTAALVFGDGAGAAVITGEEPPDACLGIVRTASHLVPGTADLLGFELLDDGFHVVLDRRLPRVLARHLRETAHAFAPGLLAHPDAIVAAHAAGPRIFKAMEAALQVGPQALAASREVFAEVGNTSSAAIFFTLERIGRRLGTEDVQFLGLGVGPGISLELMDLVWVGSKQARDETRPTLEGLSIGR